jgi:hypothetical protein
VSVGLNPLSTLTDQQLDDLQVALALACGRTKSALRDKHRVHFCAAFRVLHLEQDNRGRPRLHGPFTA